MTDQPSLFRQREQEDAQRLTAAFLTALSDGQWHLRRDLCRQIPGLTERGARLIASESRGRVIGSARGYKLTIHATQAEVDHAEAQLRSQAREMLRRVIAIRKARNAGGRAA